MCFEMISIETFSSNLRSKESDFDKFKPGEACSSNLELVPKMRLHCESLVCFCCLGKTICAVRSSDVLDAVNAGSENSWALSQ